MKTNRKMNIVLLVSFVFSFISNAQIKKIGKPSGDSFYSYKMYQNYLEDKVSDWSKLPLSGIEKQIKTHGKVIVYDASIQKVITNTDLKDGISFLNNTVLIKSNNKVHQIPIKNTNDLSSTTFEFSPSEIDLIKDYVTKSIDISGVTPADIEINLKKADFDLTINSSTFKYKKKIIKGHDIRSRAKQNDLTKQIDNVDLDLAKENINRFKLDYPNKDIYNLEEKYNTLLKIKELNSKSNANYNIKYIEENSNKKSFSVYDGTNARKDYPIEKKDNFINDLANEFNSNSTFQFLKIKGLSKNKEDAMFTSISNKIRTRDLNIEVKKYPKYNEDVFFDGTLESIVSPKYTLTNDYSGYNSYSVKLGNTSKAVRLDIEVKPKFIKEKTIKIIKSFFKFFDKNARRRAGFLESFFDAKQRIKKKFDIDNGDYNNVITNQFGQKDIVIIDDLNIFNQDNLKILLALNLVGNK